MKKSLRNKCWDAFSEMVRSKASDWKGEVRCYTCGATGRWKGDRFQAGHFQSGRCNAILFDEEQIRVQCYSCNCCKAGEQYEFGKKLEKEYGIDKVKEFKKRRHQTLKYSPKDYEAMTKVFKEKTKMYIAEKGLEQ